MGEIKLPFFLKESEKIKLKTGSIIKPPLKTLDAKAPVKIQPAKLANG